MRRTIAFTALILLGLPTVGAAQRAACGGHIIHWIGGAPRATYDRGPLDHRGPTLPEPEGFTARDRELWDALVYDAYDRPQADPSHNGSMGGLPLDQRRTLVIDSATVPTVNLCIQSADHSYTGERLAAHTDAAWWRRHFERFANVRWSGQIEVGDCSGEPRNGWVNVREGRDGEVSDGVLARASSWRYADPHGVWSEWVRSEIVWNPEHVQDLQRNPDSYVEETLAHELGHVLGLWHVPLGSGFVMMPSGRTTWPDRERWLSQWAYEVGPNVQYPGLVRDVPVPALPLVGLLLLATMLVAASSRRRAVRGN